MTKKASLIYLALAPVLFGLSWFISHRVFERFMTNGSGVTEAHDRSLGYAITFLVLYLAVFFVIRDLYKPKKA